MFSPKYVITNKILISIGEIEAAKEVIENAPIIPSFEKQFQSDAYLRTIHHGTHIEGNELTLYQTKKILEGESIVAKSRDIQEIINYRNVVELISELSFKRGGYDSQMIKDIQAACVDKIVAPEKIGVFRTSQVVIKNEDTGEIILRPPDHSQIPFLTDEFFEWLNSEEMKEVHPILVAGIVHYVLVAIHPFVEGNGRTARAFTILCLLRSGYDVKKFYSLEEHFDEDPAEYYQAFSLVDRQSPEIYQRDITPWLEYFTRVVSIELAKIKEKIRKLSLDNRLKIKIGSQVALSERQMRLVEYLSDRGGASMKELKSILKMVSEDTILRDLKDLKGKGIIKKEGSTKASRYTIASK